MRFEKYLEKNRQEKYKDHYINIKLLKDRITDSANGANETTFTEVLDENINQVFGFIQFKYEEFENMLSDIENLIIDSKGTKELAELREELSEFGEFIRINISGFKAVLARHDKKTGLELIPKYKLIKKKKLDQIEDLNKLIYKISRLILKTLKVKSKKESSSSFIRKSTKYWVHYDNIYALKLAIIKHLPLYVFKAEENDGTPYSIWNHRTHDTNISSVYLDNVDFELYLNRLHKNQGAEAIRIRWYGSKITTIVYIERKRHEDKWTGFSSRKLRFKIAEKHVLDYINGKNVWEHVKLLNGPEVFELYKEIQTAIITKHLRPMVRTFYKRCAFQLPNDASVRLSLDSNLVMIKECTDETLKANSGPIKQWRRPDVERNWPFKYLDKTDIVRFPHAILEIKTQGKDESKPDWIEKLVSSSYVEHVHKYSKFMHGMSLLYRQINFIPYWLPQMATDIRRDPFHPKKRVKAIENNEIVEIAGESGTESAEHIELVEDHGKKIAMPIRVEPKIFFANERTFLKWVQFAIFLGGVGTAILGFGDQVAALCGSMLMIVAVMFIFYSFCIFKWRMEKIEIRFPGPYDDLVGPTVLVFVFLLALILSLIFKYPFLISDENSI